MNSNQNSHEDVYWPLTQGKCCDLGGVEKSEGPDLSALWFLCVLD